jgi:hypothetical protein
MVHSVGGEVRTHEPDKINCSQKCSVGFEGGR